MLFSSCCSDTFLLREVVSQTSSLEHSPHLTTLCAYKLAPQAGIFTDRAA
jgi:hypothetical protein